jgi:hypothetical protein
MSDDLKKLEELYHQALAKPKEERAAFLAEVCAGEEALHRELQSMLEALEKAGGFMELPALRQNGIEAIPAWVCLTTRSRSKRHPPNAVYTGYS